MQPFAARTPYTTHVNTYPSFVPLPCLEEHRIPRDKTKPKPWFSSLLYTRSRQAVPPLHLDRSVYPAELSAPSSLWASDQFTTPDPCPSTGCLAVPDHHLGQTPSASTAPNARSSGFPEYFIYSPPHFFVSSRLVVLAFLSISSSCMLLFRVSTPPERRRSSSVPVLTRLSPLSITLFTLYRSIVHPLSSLFILNCANLSWKLS